MIFGITCFYNKFITENICRDTSDCITINNIGIQESTYSNVVLYPNPSNGIFIITNFSEILYFEVINLSGQVINKKIINDPHISSTQFELGNIAKGMYFVKMIGDKYICTKKIIIN